MTDRKPEIPVLGVGLIAAALAIVFFWLPLGVVLWLALT